MSAIGGENVRKAAPEDIYQFVRETDCPFVTSGDVSEAFPDASDRLVRDRLLSLAEAGHINRREIGGSGRVYWVQEDSANMSRPASDSQ
jgi:hypothetical protein